MPSRVNLWFVGTPSVRIIGTPSVTTTLDTRTLKKAYAGAHIHGKGRWIQHALTQSLSDSGVRNKRHHTYTSPYACILCQGYQVSNPVCASAIRSTRACVIEYYSWLQQKSNVLHILHAVRHRTNPKNDQKYPVIAHHAYMRANNAWREAYACFSIPWLRIHTLSILGVREAIVTNGRSCRNVCRMPYQRRVKIYSTLHLRVRVQGVAFRNNISIFNSSWSEVWEFRSYEQRVG